MGKFNCSISKKNFKLIFNELLLDKKNLPRDLNSVSDRCHSHLKKILNANLKIRVTANFSGLEFDSTGVGIKVGNIKKSPVSLRNGYSSHQVSLGSQPTTYCRHLKARWAQGAYES